MLRRGAPFTVDKLDAERKRITSLLMDRGYYRFHKDFITYSADSSKYSSDINVTLHLSKYRANNNSPETLHPCYSIIFRAMELTIVLCTFVIRLWLTILP